MQITSRLVMLAAAAAVANAQPVTLTVDSSTSKVDFDATVSALALSLSDGDDTGITGQFVVDFDPVLGTPTTLSIQSLDLAFTDDIDLTFSAGFLGSLNVDLTNASAVSDTPTATAAIAPDGTFAVPVTTAITGLLTATGTGLFADANSMTDLSTLGTQTGVLAGSVTHGPGPNDISINAMLDISESLEPATGVTVAIDVAAMVFADGQLPSCPPDQDLSGVLDIDDFSAFVSNFFAGDPIADVNADGNLDIDDFSDFVAGFFQGC
ncbi:MAG: GC-type dockerin domain-anchored protein [Planctomycetota bacterium]